LRGKAKSACGQLTWKLSLTWFGEDLTGVAEHAYGAVEPDRLGVPNHGRPRIVAAEPAIISEKPARVPASTGTIINTASTGSIQFIMTLMR
jgi:hypothetical protein